MIFFKKIFISFSILLIVIVFLVFIIYKKDIKKPADENKVLTKQELIKERIKEVDFFKIAFEKKDYSECDIIISSYTRDLCYKKVAEKSNNLLPCSYIENSDTKDMCYFFIQKSKALDKKSIEPCNELSRDNLIKACIEQVERNNFCENEACYSNN